MRVIECIVGTVQVGLQDKRTFYLILRTFNHGMS